MAELSAKAGLDVCEQHAASLQLLHNDHLKVKMNFYV